MGYLPGPGDAQQLATAQMLMNQMATRRSSAGQKRRARASVARTARRPAAKRAKATAKRPARLVKGSAAAKRYMASIRRKRRR